MLQPDVHKSAEFVALLADEFVTRGLPAALARKRTDLVTRAGGA